MTHAAETLWRALFAGGEAVGEGRELVLWFLGPENEATKRQPRRSAWATSLGGALAALEAPEVQGWATYFHVALHDRAAALRDAQEKDRGRAAAELRRAEREQRAPKRQRPPRTDPRTFRGSAASARALGALWADFDVAGPDHEKPGLPKHRDEILAKLASCPLPPSFLIYTGGGGVQAYWALREPLELADHELPRAEAYGLAKGWELFLRDGLGLLPDPTADLARIMRVPGVLDARRGKPVELAGEGGKAYNPDEFRAFALDCGPLFGREPRAGASANPQRVVEAAGLRLDSAAEPNWKKVSALLGLDARFSETWNRKRKDLSSQSEYDLSLAAQMLPLGFTQQEVVDALIYHRREGGVKEKLRSDYYAATLGKVSVDVKAEDAYQRIDTAVASGLPIAPPEAPPAELSRGAPGPASAPPPTDPRENDLAALRDTLGVDLRAVIKHPVDPDSIYVLVLGTKRYTLGGIEALLEAAVFRRKLADIARVVVRQYKPAQWTPIAKMLLRVLDEETIGTESDPQDHVADLVVSYLDMKLRPNRDQGEELVSGERQPFVDLRAGRVAVFSLEFGGWLRQRMGMEISSKRLAQMLRWAGAVPKQYRARRTEDGRLVGGEAPWTTTSAWLIPTSIYPVPAPEGQEAADGA